MAVDANFLIAFLVKKNYFCENVKLVDERILFGTWGR